MAHELCVNELLWLYLQPVWQLTTCSHVYNPAKTCFVLVETNRLVADWNFAQVAH